MLSVLTSRSVCTGYHVSATLPSPGFAVFLLFFSGTREHRNLKLDNGDHLLSSVDGCVVKNMKINNCGGEGIRLRYFVTRCTLFHNRITSTGCFDFKFGVNRGIKNGEGICELKPSLSYLEVFLQKCCDPKGTSAEGTFSARIHAAW